MPDWCDSFAIYCRETFFLLFEADRRTQGSAEESGPRHTVLVLGRAGLSEDVRTAFEGALDFNLLFAPTGSMKAIAEGFLPPQLDDNFYVSSSAPVSAQKLRYRQFLKSFLRKLVQIRKIDAITSGNFAYFAERELQNAAEEVGLPFIVLHKENLKSPARQEYFEEHYRARRGPFGGRHIIVYNEFERRIQIAAGITDSDRISVCGMPRLDRMHDWRFAHSGQPVLPQPSVVFFAFGAKTGLPVLRRKKPVWHIESLGEELDGLSWERVTEDTYAAILQFACDNPGVQVTIKSKSDSATSGALESVADALGLKIPDNIEIVEGGDPFEILKGAWVVVAMNTTAVLEALAMGKAVLTPGYAEADEPKMKPWLADFGSAVERMPTTDHLIERLELICSDQPPVVPVRLSEPTKKTLEIWAGNSDGKSASRVVSRFRHELSVDDPETDLAPISISNDKNDTVEGAGPCE